MATWKEQYLAALQARDRVEKANLDLYNYCTKLADEKAALQNKAASPELTEYASQPQQVKSPQPSSLMGMGMGLRRVTSPPIRPESPTLAQLRQDLAKAQSERSDLQTRLSNAVSEMAALSTKSRIDAKRISQLSTAVSTLTTKLRDREEELRGKAKLIENVQDENVTLNLQLNMVEERSEALKKENAELVSRWMERVGREAERMNEEGKFR